MVGIQIVAVLDWRAAAPLRENVRFFEKAGQSGRVRPPDGKPVASRQRSLILRSDGSCEMLSFTVNTVARRLRGTHELRTTPKARNGKRG